MSLLSAMIQKRERRQTTSGAGGKSVLPVATATVATFATDVLKSLPSVATVATVAVANHQTVQAANDQLALTSFGWLIHFIAREPMQVTFSPAVDHAEALRQYPDATAAEPVGNSTMREVLSRDDEGKLRALIGTVYRDDTDDDRNEALQAALADPANALACYSAIARERDIALADADERRACRQCASFTRNGICSIARPGGPISANLGYRPAPDLLQRCGAFAPKEQSHRGTIHSTH